MSRRPPRDYPMLDFDRPLPPAEFDRSAGRELAVEGMERAADHADRVEPEWRERAYQFARTFITSQSPSKPFASEEIWRAAEEAGIPPPPDRRAWGQVIRRASSGKERLITFAGYAKSKNKARHAGDAKLWQRVL